MTTGIMVAHFYLPKNIHQVLSKVQEPSHGIIVYLIAAPIHTYVSDNCLPNKILFLAHICHGCAIQSSSCRNATFLSVPQKAEDITSFQDDLL